MFLLTTAQRDARQGAIPHTMTTNKNNTRNSLITSRKHARTLPTPALAMLASLALPAIAHGGHGVACGPEIELGIARADPFGRQDARSFAAFSIPQIHSGAISS